MFRHQLQSLRQKGIRQVLLIILSLGTFAASALMTWKALCLITNTDNPIVVVLSGSMEPAFYRGDILFLTNPSRGLYKIGDIVVYKVPGQEIPIVHRIIEVHSNDATLPVEQWMLTKGDNNRQDDRIGELYGGLEWIERRHVVGKVRGFLPYVGYMSILLNESSKYRSLVFGGFALLALVQG